MKALSLFSLCVTLLPFSALAETELTNVTPDNAAKLLASAKAPVVVDVRTADEFADGHIKGAVNIDVTADDFEAKLSQLDKSKVYLVHCRSGARSTRALETFKKLGFEKIYHLNEGMLAWVEADQPVVEGK